MSERLPSDHPSVSTYRAKLARSGGTRRPCLRLPDDVEGVSPGDVVHLVLGGETYHARVDEDADGLVVRGAYDNARLVRNPGEGQNRLVQWVDDEGRSVPSSVEVDEVVPGFFYGARVPGKRAVYDVPEQPKQSLADIAKNLDGDDT
jgi:hypothetical protein